MEAFSLKKWLLVTNTHKKWTRLYEKDEISFTADKSCRKNDLILVYQQSPHNKFSFIFQVINSKYGQKGKYRIFVHNKVEIPEPVALSECKNAGLNLTGRTKFHSGLYKLNEREFSDFINLITKKNLNIFSEKIQKPCVGPGAEGYPISLKKELIDFINNLSEFKNRDLNEEETKYLIILPILRRLGWNTWNLKQVFPEHPADGKKIDYALRDYEDNEIFIEAKKLSEDLEEHIDQIKKYCIRQGITNGAITNGIEWIIYDIHYWDYGTGLFKKIDYKKLNLINEPNKDAEELINFFWKSKNKKNSLITKPPNFNEILDRIRNIDYSNYKCYNEAAVKQFLILPMLCSLGWNLRDPNEFVFSPLIKYRRKKFQPDYLLNSNGSPAVLIEVKKINDDLDHDSFDYTKDFTIKGNADIGVLTNGKKWIFILSKGRKFWGIYEHQINSYNISNTSKLLKDILSKEFVSEKENIKYLERLV